MKKATMTFYLPGKTFEQAKIEAIKKGSTFTDLAVACALNIVENDVFDFQKPAPINEQKALIYLPEKEKKKIKRFAAEKAVTLSEVFYQALEQNMASIKLPVDQKQPCRGKARQTTKNNPFSYYLTARNDSKLRLLSAETDETRTRLILKAVEQAENEMILKVPRQIPKSTRSSMSITSKELLKLKGRAQETELNVSELINRALVLY